MNKWQAKRTLLVTAAARNIGVNGINWNAVGEELEETAKSCESAFWRAEQDENGQLGDDIAILRARIAKKSYTDMLPMFPGYTLADLKDRATVLAGGTNNEWMNDARIAFLDIETTDFAADIGIMLSWAIKYEGAAGKIVSNVITKNELFTGKMDRRLCESLVKELENVDVVATYFGTGFDNVFIRTRCLILDTYFPTYGTLSHYDVYFTAKSKLKLHSKRLDSVAKALGCKTQKTPVDIAVWQKARWGDEEALGYVLEHNELDTVVLEEVYNKLRPFVKITRRSI